MFVWQQPLHADSSLKNQPIKYVVFAGGGGYRLWPLSSPDRPKQFIPFLNSSSLLKQTIERIAPVTKSPQDVMVVTLERYRDDIVRDVGELTGTIVTEPMSRNTGPALLQALKNLSKVIKTRLLSFSGRITLFPIRLNFSRCLSKRLIELCSSNRLLFWECIQHILQPDMVTSKQETK